MFHIKKRTSQGRGINMIFLPKVNTLSKDQGPKIDNKRVRGRSGETKDTYKQLNQQTDNVKMTKTVSKCHRHDRCHFRIQSDPVGLCSVRDKQSRVVDIVGMI
ncbi:hypothetical protein LOAG_02327 [Loa loa]|uniref:Uncharacterized protein n=1 Tax=Loa loa TaxID=7209 RepID=A0A1S0U8W4_LOALO|nr:hypothetical protein LOAG_02327 [Loa loa]EFO26154.1 hypothetical protein LOAG_02327 [Loa loa]